MVRLPNYPTLRVRDVRLVDAMNLMYCFPLIIWVSLINLTISHRKSILNPKHGFHKHSPPFVLIKFTKDEKEYFVENNLLFNGLFSKNIKFNDDIYWVLEGNHRHLALCLAELCNEYQKMKQALKATLVPTNVFAVVFKRIENNYFVFLLMTFLRRMYK